MQSVRIMFSRRFRLDLNYSAVDISLLCCLIRSSAASAAEGQVTAVRSEGADH